MSDPNPFSLLTQSPTSLAAARLELHWAVQLVSAAGATLAEALPDYSHTAVQWSASTRALLSVDLGDDVRAGLQLEGGRLFVSEGSTLREEIALAGETLDSSLLWLGEAMAKVRDERATPLVRPRHDLPSHAVELGAPFAFEDGPALEALSQWFGGASVLLERFAEAEPQAAPVRCWPHHFDIATLLTLDVGKDAEEARSIGVGMTPGDAGIAAPYFYVTPWPYPSSPKLPPLNDGGRWHTEGWLGAVLDGHELMSAGPDERPKLAERFVESAVSASRSLLR